MKNSGIPCNNCNCRHYVSPTKRDWAEIQVGVKEKQGNCRFSFCKLNMKGVK